MPLDVCRKVTMGKVFLSQKTFPLPSKCCLELNLGHWRPDQTRNWCSDWQNDFRVSEENLAASRAIRDCYLLREEITWANENIVQNKLWPRDECGFLELKANQFFSWNRKRLLFRKRQERRTCGTAAITQSFCVINAKGKSKSLQLQFTTRNRLDPNNFTPHWN